jgi:hypothetical protein
MSAFISKLQYKNYEPGEFTDEQARTLEETLQLIKDYPWERERYLAEVEPTCPSVTVMNELGEYLKLGPYFNHKYCLYFLDAGHHLYEMHVPVLDEACTVVTSFFEGTLPLKQFEKHTFSIGAAKHFITNEFKYALPLYSYKMYFAFSLPVLLLSIIFILNNYFINSSNLPSSPVWGICLLAAYMIGYLFVLENRLSYFGRKNSVLYISRGKNDFSYGPANDEQQYKKSDIVSIYITIYSNRSIDRTAVEYIEFKDGTKLKINPSILGGHTLLKKFPDESNFKYNYSWRYFF